MVNSSKRLVWLFILVFIASVGFIQKNTIAQTDVDTQDIRSVIEAQLRAIAVDNWPLAFSFAGSGIKRHLNSPESFKKMVLEGYRIVYRPRILSFKGKIIIGGMPGYLFYMVGLDGRAAVVVYSTTNQGNEGWRILGVKLFSAKGRVV